MNGTYGIQTRGDPPLTFDARGDPPLMFGARGDPPVANSLQGNSFERELIFSRITGQNDLDGRGMEQ